MIAIESVDLVDSLLQDLIKTKGEYEVLKKELDEHNLNASEERRKVNGLNK